MILSGRCFFKMALIAMVLVLAPRTAMAQGDPPEVVAAYEKIFSYFENHGFTVSRPKNSKRLRGTRIEKKSKTSEPGHHEIRTNVYGKQFKDWKHGPSYSLWKRVGVDIYRFKSRSQLWNNFTKYTYPDFISQKAGLEKAAQEKGIALNTPYRRPMDFYYADDGHYMGTFAGSYVYRQADGDFYLAGTERLYANPHSKTGWSWLDFLELDEDFDFCVLSGNMRLIFHIDTTEKGSGKFQTKVGGLDNFLAIVGDVYTLFTNRPFALTHTAGAPILTLKCDLSNLPADGRSAATVTVQVTRLPAKDGDDAIPVKGAVVTLENVAFKGAAPGHLSSRQVVTGADGTARVTYTAPEAEAVPKGPVPRAEIRARCAKLGLEESIYIGLDVKQPVNIKATHSIFPAHSDYTNELTFTFETPDKTWGKKYKAVLSCSSEFGRLRIGTSKKGFRELTIKDAVSGSENTVFYQWTGLQPAAAVEEIVTLEIPELKLRGVIQFSVGIDLAVDTATVSWKPPFQPHLTIPIKIFVIDRLHPDADLAGLFAEFEIEPTLTVHEDGFAPKALLTSDTDEDTLVAAAGRFIERHTGSAAAGTSLTKDLVLATVKKTPDGRWLLMEKDLSGKGLTVDQAYPAIIPYQRGTYSVSVRFDPKFKGDAAAGRPVPLKPIDVSRMSARQGELEYFLLPTLKAVASLTGAGGLGFGLTDVAIKVRRGDTAGAIVDAGAMLAGKYVGDKLGGAMEARYRESMNKFYKQRVAAAFNKSSDALPPGRYELALRLAYPYKLANWVETVTGWAVSQTIDDLKPTTGSRLDDESLPSAFLTRLFAMIVPLARASAGPPKNDPMQQSLDYLKLFMKGYGDDYGVLIVTRAGLGRIEATDAQGRRLKPAPANVFGGRNPAEMMVKGRNVVVIPFKRNTDFSVNLSGQGRSVKVYKILGDTVTSGVLDYHGRVWQKKLTVSGGR